MDLAILIPLAPFIMVLGIIWLVNNRKLEEKRIAATAEASSEKAAQYASRVQQLEDRVQVLERIVTDGGYNVATQIEALRDQRRVDDHGAGVPLDVGSKEKA
ncbi:phage shock protein B [Qipengyuania sp. 6B39]|uniref:phage shock protein B n=1 Tax=Qipengyuania proteolytica TaxID=2867239 RepID=UPI001C88F195|nr:phage shock protein B [Qipengyuania proteolytica]MBX7495233.1 phage shock protein B [Qipengyuania proteolytica]